MGRDLGELYSVLSDELIRLYWHWHEYVQLFATKSTRVSLLNESASFFFWVVQQTFWQETLLGIARLTSVPGSRGKSNLTVQRIAPFIMDVQLRADVESLVSAAVEAAAFAKGWRDRHIAHRDLDLSLGRMATPLPKATKEKVDIALESIAVVLNRLDLHFLDATMAYDFVNPIGGCESLLFVLRDGLRREELRGKQLEAGNYDPEEWDDHLGPV